MTKLFSTRFAASFLAGSAAALLLGLSLAASAHANGVPLLPGNVLVSLGNGKIGQFTPTGSLVDTLDTTASRSEETGMCFDAAQNLYTTNFEADSMSKFDKNGNLVAASFGSGFNQDPESCVVDQSQHIYVGQADGSHQVREFDTSGNLLNSFSPDVSGQRGTDWIDLAADQKTLHYTGEGSEIRTFNVSTNTQGPVFASGLPAPCFAHRILPDGTEVVACSTEVLHLDSSGNQIMTYPVDPNNDLFALSINPDGKSFWTADFNGTVWNVDIGTGTVLHTFSVASTPGFGDTAGLAVIGELTVAQDPPITGKGTSVSATEGKSFSGTVATFSDADSTATASQYSATITWGDGTTSSGSISGSLGQFTVNGSHTYAEEGSRTITVTITDADTTSNSATATSAAKVADAALSATGVKPSLAGTKASGTVATFTDSDPGGTVSDYSASINWGDGSTSAGTVSKSGSHFSVSGKHTYAKSGKYTLKITIKDGGGSTATATVAVAAAVKAAKVSAKLSSIPRACVAGAFTARVQGTRIASVRFTLDGAVKRSTTVQRHRQYSSRIGLSPGSHTLTVKITFLHGSAARFRTFHRTVTGCTPPPSFTG